MPNDLSPTATPISFRDALAAIELRIAQTPVRTKPFPHLIVDDLLPQTIRRSIDQYWPTPDRFGTANHFQRGEASLLKIASSSADYERRFWVALQQLVIRTNRAVRERLEPYLDDKFRPLLGPDWREQLGAVEYVDHDAMLTQYSGLLDMAPHIDNARVVINGFVYLDDPDMPTPQPRRGTMLYRSLGFSWPSNTPIPAQYVKQFLRETEEPAWQDNRLLAYVNGPWSFHGVKRHDLGDSRRRLLMFGSLLDRTTAQQLLGETLG